MPIFWPTLWRRVPGLTEEGTCIILEKRELYQVACIANSIFVYILCHCKEAETLNKSSNVLTLMYCFYSYHRKIKPQSTCVVAIGLQDTATWLPLSAWYTIQGLPVNCLYKKCQMLTYTHAKTKYDLQSMNIGHLLPCLSESRKVLQFTTFHEEVWCHSAWFKKSLYGKAIYNFWFAIYRRSTAVGVNSFVFLPKFAFQFFLYLPHDNCSLKYS